MPAASALAALDLMRRETELRPGPVPRQLGGQEVLPGHYRINRDEFLLWTDTGLGFHYRRGAGVQIDEQRPAPPGEVELWHHGSVYAAVAAINGLVPLHASAIAHDGQVHAFSGPSGAGKSTLAAGLGRRGFPMFCDDTLLLDLSADGPVWCLPGHKRLKLDAAALALTGAAAQEKVGGMIDKAYAQPVAGIVAEPLPLASVTFIEEGADLAVQAVHGAGRIGLFDTEHYSLDYLFEARGLDRPGRLALLAELARRLPVARLVRPRDASQFETCLDRVAAHVQGHAA